jgi:hypothetical protein
LDAGALTPIIAMSADLDAIGLKADTALTSRFCGE